MRKSVVHVNCADAERQGHGLKNIENILQDVEAEYPRCCCTPPFSDFPYEERRLKITAVFVRPGCSTA